jgi:mxaJ protein
MNHTTARPRAVVTLLVTLIAAAVAGTAAAASWEMRVCADPNSLPFSRFDESGFENRIATILADELDAELTYLWWPQADSMIDHQLREGECDLIMGVPDGFGSLLTTLAYYRSPYVFVYKADRGYDLATLYDPILRDLRLGVGRAGSAVHEVLLDLGLGGNIVLQFGDRGYGLEGDALAIVVDAVVADEIDVGISWGPAQGFFAQQHGAELVVRHVTPDFYPPFLNMVIPMAIGVRRGDESLRDLLNLALAARWDDVNAVLAEYGVPISPLPRPRATGRTP